MNYFSAAANEVGQWADQAATWAQNNTIGALMVAGVFTAAAGIAVIRLREHFARPTPTAFDDPKIKASRARSAELFKRLGIRHSEP